jgi:hypothetical protein
MITEQEAQILQSGDLANPHSGGQVAVVCMCGLPKVRGVLSTDCWYTCVSDTCQGVQHSLRRAYPQQVLCMRESPESSVPTAVYAHLQV